MGEPIHQFEIIEAIKKNDFCKINYLMEHGMIEGSPDTTGSTFLHLAVKSHCDVNVIKYFTESIGIHPLSDDCYGVTPYDLAITEALEDIIAYFEKYTGIKRNELMHNPVLPGFFPDPSIVAEGDDFYMVNSSFMYFPCIPISHSRDLVNWEIVGYAISDPSYIDLSDINPGHGFWAPDISYSNGKFYITATLRENNGHSPERHQIIVTSDRPEGPYSKPVFIEEDGIDPSLFHDDDGRHYMLLNKGARLIPLSDDCLSVTGPSKMLYYGWNRHASEGPHLIKKDGFYYLFLAEGGTGDGHMETVARSESLEGPYTPCPHNPLLNQTRSSAYLTRTGHGKPFKTSSDDWYMVYLCSRKYGTAYSLLGRETALCRLTWNSDGWPVANDGLGALATMKAPFGVTAFQRQIAKYDLSYGLPETFFNHKGFTLTRQTDVIFNTSLKLSPLNAKEGSFGIIFYYDDNSYLKYGIKVSCEVSTLYVTLKNAAISPDELTAFEESFSQTPKQLTLCVNTNLLKKAFFYKADNNAPIEATFLDDCSFLTDEGISMGKRFEGPMFGLFGFKENAEAFIAFETDK